MIIIVNCPAFSEFMPLLQQNVCRLCAEIAVQLTKELFACSKNC